jgi:uncharacterized membrane protein YeiH
MACCVGGLIYSLCVHLGIALWISQLACAGSVILIRILAVRFHWQLPIMKE